MGEFADYAIDEVFDHETWVADNLLDEREPHPFFEHGVKDLEGLERDCQLYSSMLDGYNPTERYVPVQEVNPTNYKDIRKYSKKWEMILGMAKFYMDKGYLTEKQEKWMETNHKRGTKGFKEELDQYGEDMVASINKIKTFVCGE